MMTCLSKAFLATISFYFQIVFASLQAPIPFHKAMLTFRKV